VRAVPPLHAAELSQRIHLAWSLREQTERGVYAASAWRDPCDVAELPERQENADDEAA
jgi:hypothetical protein